MIAIQATAKETKTGPTTQPVLGNNVPQNIYNPYSNSCFLSLKDWWNQYLAVTLLRHQ
jgi:hypothetical protein